MDTREARRRDEIAPIPTHAPVDTSEFESIYVETYQDVWRYAYFLLRDPVTAQDLASDVFTRAFAAWQAGHGPRAAARPWLLTITRRLALNHARRARLIRWVPLVRPIDRSNVVEGLAEREFRLWLDQLAELLTPRERDALFLRYLGDLADDAAGRILGVSASGFRTLVSRAIMRLRANQEVWQ
jgi:RNA polymerase sigma-70 factor (ECF subfamily)